MTGHGVSWYSGTRLAPLALTCSLRISGEPTSDHLTPQETTRQDASEVGSDGTSLSCPGSSVVAGSKSEDVEIEIPPSQVSEFPQW
jgi:hypothetical protein